VATATQQTRRRLTTNTPMCWLATAAAAVAPAGGTNTKQPTLTPEPNRTDPCCHRAPLQVDRRARQALGVVGAPLAPFLALLRGHNSRGLPAVRCVGAEAERRGGVLCVAPAYVVSPQGGAGAPNPPPPPPCMCVYCGLSACVVGISGCLWFTCTSSRAAAPKQLATN
jgi:hypothetical protein